MKTKNILFSALIGAASIFGFTSCDNGFDAINTNPNEVPENKHPFYITDIAQAIQYASDYNYDQKSGAGAAGGADLHQRAKSLGVDIFVQYNMGRNDLASYASDDGYQSVYWGAHFVSYLGILNKALAFAEEKNDVNAKAIALTWRAHTQAQFTDYFGIAPFPTRQMGDTVPPYMELKDQYNQIFTDLATAIDLFDPAEATITSEPLYKGDVGKWKKFCNTLRVRLAIKMSEIDPALCSKEIKAALSSANGGLLASSADDAKSATYGAWGSINNPYTYYYGWGLTGGKTTMSKTMEKILTGIGGQPYNGTAAPGKHPTLVDPRGSIIFDPCPKDDKLLISPTWQGGIVGQNPEPGTYRNTISEMSVQNFSQNFKRPMTVMTYTEACLLLAEAVERNFITAGEAGGTAESWYNKGVEASFIDLGLTAADAATYLASNAKNEYGTSALYSDTSGPGNTALEKIVTQRYIGFFPDLSNNIWNDKRRLNLPAMEIPVYRNSADGIWPNDDNIKNPKNFIQRLRIPQSEPRINKEYYDAAVQMLGGDGDKNSTSIWWATGINYCTSN